MERVERPQRGADDADAFLLRALTQVIRVTERAGDPEIRARTVLEHVHTIVRRVPDRIDRASVIQALGEGLFIRATNLILNTEWFVDRDLALKRVDRSVQGLRKVLERTKLPIDNNISGLESALQTTRRMPLLAMKGANLDHVRSRKAGRPVAEWHKHTARALRLAGVSARTRADLLRAVGLTATVRKTRSRF